ncbi:MAG: hypothetical protein IPH44_36155 [Myxococcales bacterium]|nr:hypothetical protein [Myxococcales bacterium]MBK7191224.1 hypothetical protein [Myxococcales bacterium]MBP6842598.1 hypothetical protein [Kofleriaceae bacterium]
MTWHLASLFQSQLRTAEDEAERAHEVVIGVVVDIKDPSRLCRVKVKIPVLGPDATWWCPVVAIGAGRDRGWFTLPEVDDEVLVGFEHGEVARPIVIGQIWNGSDKPTEANPGGDNPRRVFASKSGHTVTFDDKDGKLVIADGAGIGTVTIAKDAGITIEAKQGCVAIQAQDEVTIVAGEIAITGKAAVDLMGKSTGVNGTGKAGVKINGNMVALKGSTIDINPGGVAAAAKADATVAEVPDSDPATGSGGGADGGQASAQAGGGASGGGGGGSAAAGGAGNASPGPAAAESAATESPEPVPALLSARWVQAKVPVGATVELAAMCLDLAGQSASFEIRPADGGAPVATVSGTCGDAVANATWTTPKDTRVAQYTFTVTAGGQSAESDVLTLVKPFAATLMLDELPAFGVEVELETVETGERVRATADADGKVAIAEAAIGTWKLHLVSAEDA